MKKSIIVLALFAAASGAAFAQDTNVNSGSTSGSNSGATSGSQSAINSGAATTTAIGNQAGAQSNASTQSGAQAGSQSGALGNVVNIDQRGPTSQTINSTGSSTSNNTTNLGGGTNNTDNVKYSGAIENRVSGGTYSTVNENVHYSGTQTIKNVPGIAMSGPASGPCTGASGGLGVAGPGFGVGLNGAKVDDGCTVRENTRVLGQLFQSLDSNDPAKPVAKAALMRSLAILDTMNYKIAQGIMGTPEAPPEAQPKKVAEVAPTPQQAVVTAKAGEPTDPYIRARMGLK